MLKEIAESLSKDISSSEKHKDVSINPESKSIMKDLFKDDFKETEGSKTQDYKDLEIDGKSEINKLFADDYNDGKEIKAKSDFNDKNDGIKKSDNPDRIRMEPQVRIVFNFGDRYDILECERQVKDQQKGMNKLTLYEYCKNREKYLENGRDTEQGMQAQKKAREEALADRIAENRRNGMKREDAEKEANEWIRTKAALHNPDQIAGGNPFNISGLGDAGVNSSIGSQWKNRISIVDEAVRKHIKENNLMESDLKKVYLNVKLEACR